MTKLVLRLFATISSAYVLFYVVDGAHAVKARVLDEQKEDSFEEDGVFWKFDTKDEPDVPSISYGNIVDILDTYKAGDVSQNDIVSVENQGVHVNVKGVKTHPKNGASPPINNVRLPSSEDYQDGSEEDSIISPVVDSGVSLKSRQKTDEKSPTIKVETEANRNWQENSKSKSLVIGQDEHDNDEHAPTMGSNRKFNTVPTELTSSSTSHGTLQGKPRHIRKERLSLMLNESTMWIGVGAGVGSSLVVCSLVVGVYIIMRKRRGRCSNLKELYVDNPKEDKPIYIKLSQLHRPKRSPNYVVTVLDESNFSVDSDGSSEEELFDLSNITSSSSPYKKKINVDKNNMTSTPKKNNR